MDNITGSGKSWLNETNNQSQSEAKEEIIVKKKVLDKGAIKKLLSTMEDTYTEIDRLYLEKPTKSLSDSAVMLRCAISSMKDNLTNN